MVTDLVSKFVTEKYGHPLGVTVPEAQLLHDFATWLDCQPAQHSVEPTFDTSDDPQSGTMSYVDSVTSKGG